MPEKNVNFDEVIERRNTDCLKFDFAKRNGKPEDVLPLWVADMDFKTSSLVLDEIRKRVDHGIFGYSDSGEHYFKAVSGWLLKHHNLEIKPSWIVKTPGVVFAIAIAVRAYSKEGDSVLIQQPVYYPFSRVILDNKRVPVSSDLVLGEDGKYHIDFEDFENKIVENHVKLFILCSPHNPVGRVWTVDELKRIAEICMKHQVVVMSDEIHEDFTFEGYTHTPLINVDERIKDYCVIATAPSKTFNLAGLQISNVIIENAKLRHAFNQEIKVSGYGLSNSMGIVACEAAYNYGEEWYLALKKYLKGNLDFVRDYLERELPEIKLIEPEGTYLIWLDFRSLGLCEEERENLIVNKAKLWLDSGAIFGPAGEGFERINIATSRATLEEAMNRIRDAIRESYR